MKSLHGKLNRATEMWNLYELIFWINGCHDAVWKCLMSVLQIFTIPYILHGSQNPSFCVCVCACVCVQRINQNLSYRSRSQSLTYLFRLFWSQFWNTAVRCDDKQREIKALADHSFAAYKNLSVRKSHSWLLFTHRLMIKNNITMQIEYNKLLIIQTNWYLLLLLL